MKKSALACLGLFVLAGAYLALWAMLAKNLEKQADIALGNLQAQGFGVERRVFALSGFPGTPKVSISGVLTLPGAGVRIEIPSLTVSGFLLPGLPFAAEIEGPLKVSGMEGVPLAALAGSLERARVVTILPARWPRDSYRETLEEWRAAGGAFEIREIFAALSGETVLFGAGRVDLDSELNPQGLLDLVVTEPRALSDVLVRAGLLKIEHAALAGAVIGAMAKPDAQSGKKSLKIDFTLSNRVLTLGPLKIAELPRPAWLRRPPPSDTRNSPAPPR